MIPNIDVDPNDLELSYTTLGVQMVETIPKPAPPFLENLITPDPAIILTEIKNKDCSEVDKTKITGDFKIFICAHSSPCLVVEVGVENATLTENNFFFPDLSFRYKC